MKKRLNILCALVFITVAIGFLPFFYAVGVGFQTGVEGNSSQSDELDEYVEATTVNLMPARFVGLDHGTITNKVTGESVDFWPERIAVDLPVSYPQWFMVVNNVSRYMVYALLIAIVVLFLRLIVRVNRGMVFEWRNVRLLRWLGAIELAGSIVTTIIQIYGASIVSKQFGVSGFVPDYFSYVSAMELTVGLVALIVAEIFAVGLKMKEEQDLTV